jgi:hypothetical protein
VQLQTERPADLVHLNRVEGLFTGLGVTANLRDRAPGLTLRASAGYAWSEGVVRGRIGADLQRERTAWSFRAGRVLDLTNDFRSPFDSGSMFGALSGIDEYDYVDRRIALASVTRRLYDRVALRLETGVVADHGVDASLEHGLIRVRKEFLPNRGVREGTYARNAVQLELRPDLDPSLARTGRSMVLRYERGDGEIDYQRIHLRLMTRTNRGDWTYGLRFDAGALVGPARVPQQMFELGRSENLQAYRYKEFVGDRAAVARAIVMRRLPVLQAPIHLFGPIWLPEPSPALAVSIQSGWTQLSNPAARVAALELLTTDTLRATGNPRTTIGAGIRFFGGSVGLMAVRAIDSFDRWSLRLDFRPQP